MALTLWIFLISPLLAMSVCVVAKCCILTHKSLIDKYGKKDEDSEDDGIEDQKCRNVNRNCPTDGVTAHKPIKKYAKFKINKRKSSKAPLLEPFNWDDLFPKHDYQPEAVNPVGATRAESHDRRTSRDYLLSQPVINGHYRNHYGVFDKRKQNNNYSKRYTYGCYTNLGRRFSNDPEAATQNLDINRNTRNGVRCHGDIINTGQQTSSNCGASRGLGPSSVSNRGGQVSDRCGSGNQSNNMPVQVNIQNPPDIINSCVQRTNELTAALRYCNTVYLPPLNGVSSTAQVGTTLYTNQVNLSGAHNAFQLASSCSSLASSNQQQCFCDSSMHISLRCRQCQNNWLADPAWCSRRSILVPSSSESQESERALSIDSKMWNTPTPPPPYDEALSAPERIHRIDMNNEGPPPYNSVYHLNTNTLPFSIATQAIQPEINR